MPTPSTPKEDAILDRIVTVLAAMNAGATYWFTAGMVSKRFMHWSEVTSAFPVYMVSLGSGGERVLNSHANIDETFYVSIKGYIRDDVDSIETIAKCWQDIRVALTVEMELGTAGTLPVLGVIQCRIREFPETDDGYLAVEGFGFFDIRVEVQINDTTGYI